MRRLGYILALLVAVAAVAFGVLSSQKTDAIEELANRFLVSVSQDDMAQALSTLSSEFIAHTSEVEISRYLRDSGLQRYQSAQWSLNQISRRRAILSGEVEATDSSIIPLDIEFVHERGDWRIYALRRPTPGWGPAEMPLPIPSPSGLVALSQRSMVALGKAINSTEFDAFYSMIAPEWRRSVSQASLKKSFLPFADKGVDLTQLENVSPVFDPAPTMTRGDELLMQGYFPAQPNRTYFRFRYRYAHLGWQLSGVSLQIR